MANREMTAVFLSVMPKQTSLMTTANVIRRGEKALPLFKSPSEKVILSFAAVNAAISFAAIFWQSDSFMYLCGVLALLAVYTNEAINGKEVKS